VKHYPLWGWRIVFFIGGFLGLGILILRNNLEETPSFKKKAQTVIKKAATPLKDILRRRKRNLLCTMGIAAGANLPFFTVLIYINTILSADLSVSNADILIHNVWVLLFWTALLPLFGALGDKIGEKKLMLLGAICLIVIPVPLMQWFLSNKTISTLMVSRVLLSLIAMAIVAPCSAFLSRLFPVEERQTGLGFGYFMGAALFGGTAPSICLYFSGLLNSPLFPGIYLSLFGIVTFICLKTADVEPKTKY
jgi:MHS family proline/betaine transporter-like MFS transporter